MLDHRLLEGLRSVDIKSITLSDHAPVEISLDIGEIPPGQRVWRIDESLLKDTKIAEDLEKDMGLFFK